MGNCDWRVVWKVGYGNGGNEGIDAIWDIGVWSGID